MDLVATCKDKLSHFRIKELKDVLSQLGLSKQGKKQDLVDRILSALSDGQGLSNARNKMGRDEVAKLVDDTYRLWATMAHPLSSVNLVITSVPGDGIKRMQDIPDEILREILSRLPVAPLLRFKCVSKSWKRLIEDEQFIKHHLNHSRKTNPNLNIILCSSSNDLYSVDYDSLNQTNMATFKELSHPLESADNDTRLLGSCDGLLLLRNDRYDVTLLWNPSVRRFHEIPVCGNKFPGYKKAFYYGFGYDSARDDYKLIRIVQYYGKDYNGFDSEVKVYSVKSNSWRRIEDFPYKIETDGVFANDALHWKVKLQTHHLVVAVDLGTEELRLVPLPKFAGGDHIINSRVAVLGGCLSLMVKGDIGRDEVGIQVMKIWVMKEYGAEESWSILCTVNVSDFWPYTMLAYSKCGRKVLLGGYHKEVNKDALIWYDLDKKSIDEPMVQMPSGDLYDMYTCVQSLVLLSNGACDFDIVSERKRGRKNRKKSYKTRND